MEQDRNLNREKIKILSDSLQKAQNKCANFLESFRTDAETHPLELWAVFCIMEAALNDALRAGIVDISTINFLRDWYKQINTSKHKHGP